MVKSKRKNEFWFSLYQGKPASKNKNCSHVAWTGIVNPVYPRYRQLTCVKAYQLSPNVFFDLASPHLI